MIETVRVSQKAKDQLITLKRRTGIQNWNVLCRWAFCTSLAEPSVPPNQDIATDSSVEMSWRVFGGQHHELYMALLKHRCKQDNIELSERNLHMQFKLHLHRGIGYLIGTSNLNTMKDLVSKVM